MTWSDFIWALAVVYAVYYGLNIVYDLLGSSDGTNKDEIVPLTFDDDTEAKDVDSMDDLASGGPAVARPAGSAMADSIVSGGLEYGDLLKQAVKGAISRSSQINFGEA